MKIIKRYIHKYIHDFIKVFSVFIETTIPTQIFFPSSRRYSLNNNNFDIVFLSFGVKSLKVGQTITFIILTLLSKTNGERRRLIHGLDAGRNRSYLRVNEPVVQGSASANGTKILSWRTELQEIRFFFALRILHHLFALPNTMEIVCGVWQQVEWGKAFLWKSIYHLILEFRTRKTANRQRGYCQPWFQILHIVWRTLQKI